MNSRTEHLKSVFQRKARKGFTLIETLFALFALTMGAVTGFAVLSQSLRISPTVRQELIATHIGQEAIEVVRNIRDARLLQIADEIAQGSTPDRDWAQDIEACGNTEGEYRTLLELDDLDDPNAGWIADCRNGSLGDRPQVYMEPNTGFIANACDKNQCKKLGWVDTGLGRIINVDKYVDATWDNSCADDCTAVHLKVKVYWNTDIEPVVCPGENCVLIEDRLTGWVDFLEGFL